MKPVAGARGAVRRRARRAGATPAALGAAVAAGLLASGCAAALPPASGPTPFRVVSDSFAFENEILWEYEPDAPTGEIVAHPRETPPEFAQRCVAMARSVRQFRVHARFEPGAPRLDEAGYAKLVAEVLARDKRRKSPAPDPIVIPGYPDLHAFSVDHRESLQLALGGPSVTYLQRGNWRMIFPFSEGQQRGVAEALVRELAAGELPIVHVLRYPRTTINHTVLVYEAEELPSEVRFRAYDPNAAGAPVVFTWDRGGLTFVFPRTIYFSGGPVKVYETYDGPFF